MFALWFGHDKPDMTAFLQPFVDTFNRLSEQGINCKIGNTVKNLKVYALCCCVDTVARAPMQGMIQYNGKNGCNWCHHLAEYVICKKGGCNKYTLLEEAATDRTHRQTRDAMTEIASRRAKGSPIAGVQSVSPLIYLTCFDIINGFVPNFMHCVDLDVAKYYAAL